MGIIDPDKPVFVDPATTVRRGPTAYSQPVPLWRVDFYGAPAWAFWVLCISLGIIVAGLTQLART